MAYKILLADDSVTVQKIITLTFSDEGVDVETVNNGDEAINKLQYFRPSLVMADVSIPGKDGYQICEYVKTNPDLKHIPVVLLVPAFEPFDAEKARRMGANHHLTKPFQSIRTLITTVKNLIEPPQTVEVTPAAAPLKEDLNNVVDMTSRIAPVREETEAVDDFLLPVAEPQTTGRVYNSVATFPKIDEEDHVLDIDDVLGEAWPSAEVGPIEAAEPREAGQAGQTVVISQSQIDDIVDRVVARLTDSLADKLREKLAPALTEEIISRIAPEMAERNIHQPDDRQLSFHDPDALLEIDEI